MRPQVQGSLGGLMDEFIIVPVDVSYDCLY